MPSSKVLKKNLKKKDATKLLVKRASATIQTRHLKETEPNATCPPRLTSAVEHITSRFSIIKNKIEIEQPVLLPSLRSLDDQKIKELKDLFSGSGSTEDKLYQASFILLGDELDYIESCENFLNYLKNQVIETFVSAYAQEFSSKKGSSLMFNNQDPKRCLTSIQDYRHGIRDRTEDQAQDQDGIVEENRCSIM